MKRGLLIFTEIENIITKSLKNQILLEIENAKKNDNLFSYSLGHIALKLTTKTYSDIDFHYLKSKFQTVKNALHSGKIKSILNIEFLAGIVLAFRLLHECKYKKISATEKKILNKLLMIVSDENWLNSDDLASYTIFALHDLKGFESIISKAASKLFDEFMTAKRRRNLRKLTMTMFGLSFTDKGAQIINNISDTEIKGIVSDQLADVKDLARLGISLYNLGFNTSTNKQLIADLVQKIEDKLREEFYGTLNFLVQQGIKEAASLIIAGFNERESNDMLKRISERLADLIEIKGQTIVLKQIPLPIELPTMDIEAHSLALILLTLTGREKLYVLDEENLNLVLQGVKGLKKDFTPIKNNLTTLIRWISIFLAFTIIITTSYVFFGARFQEIIGILQLAIGKNPTALLALTQPTIIIFIEIWLTVTWARFLDLVFKKGEVDRENLIEIMPIIDWLYAFLKWRRKR